MTAPALALDFGTSNSEVVPAFRTVLQRFYGVSGLSFMLLFALPSLPNMRRRA
jgi:hypothetical protein